MKRFITLSVLVFLSINTFSQVGLDNSFNSNGKLKFSGLGTDQIRAIATQANGKVILVGNSYHLDDNDISVVRLNINGSFDTSFSGDGSVTISGAVLDFAESCIVLKDNSILIVGSSISVYGDHEALIVKLMSNGKLDSSFGTAGRLILGLSSYDDKINSIAIGSDEKIYVTGITNNAFFIARLISNGTLDNAFGNASESNTGVIIENLGTGMSEGVAVCVQPDGKIIVGGTYVNSDYDLFIMRLQSSGSIDPTFGFNSTGLSKIDVSIDDKLKEIKIDQEKRIWVGGTSNDDFLVAKLKVNGSLDSSFNSVGKKSISVSANSIENLSGISLQQNGSILVAGETDHKYLAVRLLSNGNPDENFGNQGTSIVSLEMPIHAYTTTAFQNRIYLAGSIDNDFSVVALSNNELALPVHLLSFYATGLNEKVVLGWATQNEENISNYTIEKSVDGKAFKPIGYVFSVPGKTSSSYSFTDENPSTGDAHYRLKIVSHDGVESFSKVILVRSFQNTSSTAYPNPVHSSLQVVLKSNSAKELAIINASGHILKRIPVPASTGNTIIPVDVNALPAGTYFIRAGKEIISFRKI